MRFCETCRRLIGTGLYIEDDGGFALCEECGVLYGVIDADGDYIDEPVQLTPLGRPVAPAK